jgi:C-terminal processing protease CtpA/Prc
LLSWIGGSNCWYLNQLPASNLLLQIGDVVVAVDGLNVEAATVKTVTELLRGPLGSQVKETGFGL